MRRPSYKVNLGITGQHKKMWLCCWEITRACLNRMTQHILGYLSSMTTYSGGKTAQSVSAVESNMDNGLHPEPWHGEENHNDVLNRRAEPTGVTVVGAKTWRFRSAAHSCQPKQPWWAQASRSGYGWAHCRPEPPTTTPSLPTRPRGIVCPCHLIFFPVSPDFTRPSSKGGSSVLLCIPFSFHINGISCKIDECQSVHVLFIVENQKINDRMEGLMPTVTHN